MNNEQKGCCGHRECCADVNTVDTTNCREQDEQGGCCGDNSKCADALEISGKDCPERAT